MKVRELIEALKLEDPEVQVHVWDHQRSAYMPIEAVDDALTVDIGRGRVRPRSSTEQSGTFRKIVEIW